VLTVLTLLLLAALCGWLWSCVKAASVPGASFLVLRSDRLVAMAPVPQGMIFGLLALGIVVTVALAVRKVRADDEFFVTLRWSEAGRERETPAPWAGRSEDMDVFAALRLPGGAVPAEDARRILIACAAEARCIAKHLRRAQTTLSVDDYGDELTLAERKLEGVIRCVEALAERMRISNIEQGTSKAEGGDRS